MEAVTISEYCVMAVTRSRTQMMAATAQTRRALFCCSVFHCTSICHYSPTPLPTPCDAVLLQSGALIHETFFSCASSWLLFRFSFCHSCRHYVWDLGDAILLPRLHGMQELAGMLGRKWPPPRVVLAPREWSALCFRHAKLTPCVFR